MIEKGEALQGQTLLVLLDWAKAFDKVKHVELINALQRMNIPDKLVRIMRMFYTEPTFCVEMDGKTSSWCLQETGIRQGCLLSPYLFIIVMTVLFHDIHENDANRIA